MAAIRCLGLTKAFPGGVQAVSGLDLDISDGEFLVLVGPSGCGKSTALRMIAGLEDISAGTLEIGGRPVNHLSPQARNIAMVFQSYALYPHLDVWHNLAFPLQMRGAGADEIRRRVAEASAILGLDDLLRRKPKELSGGQRQRVAMGRALVREPVAFLMDEPLSNLDAKLRVQMRSEISALQRRTGTTTVYVTHDQVEAMTMGSRVAVLRGGVLQQVAAPQELYEHPVNVFVAGFMGSPAMNLFRAPLVAGPGLRLGEQVLPLPARFAAHAGQDIYAGLRPEAFVEPERVPPAQRLRTTVEDVEVLGHERLVHLPLPAPRLELGERSSAADRCENPLVAVARLGAHFPARPGDSVEVGLDTAQVHAFALDGRRLG